MTYIKSICYDTVIHVGTLKYGPPKAGDTGSTKRVSVLDVRAKRGRGVSPENRTEAIRVNLVGRLNCVLIETIGMVEF